MTEVALQFQRPPHLPIPPDQITGLEADALVLSIQPDQGISLRFGAKVPGHSFRVRTARHGLSSKNTFSRGISEAYGCLLLNALVGDPTLRSRN